MGKITVETVHTTRRHMATWHAPECAVHAMPIARRLRVGTVRLRAGGQCVYTGELLAVAVLEFNGGSDTELVISFLPFVDSASWMAQLRQLKAP